MTLDWITALKTQDDSMESLLAKRDLQKQIAPLLDVARQKETMRSNVADEQARTEALAEQSKYREAVQAQTAEERAARAERSAIDDKRAKQGLIIGKLKPGDRVRDPEVIDAVRSTVGQDQLVPDDSTPDDPTDHIYRKHEFEQEQLKLKQDEELEREREKRAKDAEKRDQARLSMAEKDQKNRDAAADRAAKTFEKRQKDTETIIKDIPISLRGGIKPRAKEILDANSGVWNSIMGRTQEMNESDATIMAATEIKKKAQEAGLMPLDAAGVTPRTSPAPGATAATGTAPKPRKVYDLHGNLVSGG